MRSILALLVISAVLVMSGCGSIFSKSTYSPTPRVSQKQSGSQPKDYGPKTNPYTVMGKTYYPLKSAAGYDEVGIASWYGKDFHGKPTANGQTYNMYGISAAHKTLPLGTKVRVTNLHNNASAVMIINDRGPFVHGRIIDLSYGAAKALGTVSRGVAKVRVTALGSGPVRVKRAPSAVAKAPLHDPSGLKYYHVRVGAFSDRANADRLFRRLLTIGFMEASISTEMRGGKQLHIVQAGTYTSKAKAEEVLEMLRDDFPSCYIAS